MYICIYIYIYIYTYIYIQMCTTVVSTDSSPPWSNKPPQPTDRAWRSAPVVHPVSITRFPLSRFSPGAGLLRYVFFIGSV